MKPGDYPTWTNGGGLLLALVVLVLIFCLVQIVARRLRERKH